MPAARPRSLLELVQGTPCARSSVELQRKRQRIPVCQKTPRTYELCHFPSNSCDGNELGSPQRDNSNTPTTLPLNTVSPKHDSPAANNTTTR